MSSSSVELPSVDPFDVSASFALRGAALFPTVYVADPEFTSAVLSLEYPEALAAKGIVGVECLQGTAVVASLTVGREALAMDQAALFALKTHLAEQKAMPAPFLAARSATPLAVTLRGATAVSHTNAQILGGRAFSPAGFLACTPCEVSFGGTRWEMQPGQVFLGSHGMEIQLAPANGEESCLVKTLALEAAGNDGKYRKQMRSALEKGVVPQFLHKDNNWLYADLLQKHKLKRAKGGEEAPLFAPATLEDCPQFAKQKQGGKRKADASPSAGSPPPAEDFEEARAQLRRVDESDVLTKICKGTTYKNLQKQLGKEKPPPAKVRKHADKLRGEVDQIHALWTEAQGARASLEALDIPEGSAFNQVRSLRASLLSDLARLGRNEENLPHGQLCKAFASKTKQALAAGEKLDKARRSPPRPLPESIDYSVIRVPDASSVRPEPVWGSAEDFTTRVLEVHGKKLELYRVTCGALKCEPLYRQWVAENKRIQQQLAAKVERVDLARSLFLSDALARLVEEKEALDRSFEKKRDRSQEMPDAHACKHPRRPKLVNGMCGDCFRSDMTMRISSLAAGEDRYDDKVAEKQENGDLEFVGPSEDAGNWDEFHDATALVHEAERAWKANRTNAELALALQSAVVTAENLLPAEYHDSNNEDDADDEDEDGEEMDLSDDSIVVSDEDEESNYEEDEEEECSGSSEEQTRRPAGKREQAAVAFMDVFSAAPFEKERDQGFADWRGGLYDKVLRDAQEMRRKHTKGYGIEYTDSKGDTHRMDALFASETKACKKRKDYAESFPERVFRVTEIPIEYPSNTRPRDEEEENGRAKRPKKREEEEDDE